MWLASFPAKLLMWTLWFDSSARESDSDGRRGKSRKASKGSKIDSDDSMETEDSDGYESDRTPTDPDGEDDRETLSLTVWDLRWLRKNVPFRFKTRTRDVMRKHSRISQCCLRAWQAMGRAEDMLLSLKYQWESAESQFVASALLDLNWLKPKAEISHFTAGFPTITHSESPLV